MVTRLSPPKRRDLLDFSLVSLFVFVLFYSFPSLSFAAAGRFTDIFETKSFQGSWETVQGYNWLGQFNRWLISTICVVGLIAVIAQRMTSLLYLSSRSTWDAVWEAKEEDKGSGILGLKGSFMKFKDGNRGVGIDAFIQMFYVILPNVKYFSDFNPNRKVHNVKEDDSAPTYMLKVFLPTAVMVFFFSAGFDGSLVKAYGMVANGMSAVSDKLVETNLEGYITAKLNTGESYNFTLGANGTKSMLVGESIAKDLYSKVLSRTGIIDTPTRLELGKAIENEVYSKILGSGDTEEKRRTHLESFLVGGTTTTAGKTSNSLKSEEEMDALNYDVIINTNNTGGSKGLDFSLKELVGKAGTVSYTSDLGSSLYAHVVFTKSKVHVSDYFLVPNASQTNTNANTGKKAANGAAL